MHSAFVAITILAAASAGVEGRRADGVSVFRCAFDGAWDANYDKWPDGWERKTGPGFPRYVGIAIEEDSKAVASRCLKIRVDGGGATTRSPHIPVSALYSYRLTARLRTAGLRYNHVFATIGFYDATGKLLQSVESRRFRHVDDWTDMVIGPITLESPEASRAVIGLHVLPGMKADLRGTVSFDDVRLARLPRIVVQTNSRNNVYTPPGDVVVTCEVSGISERDPTIHFELLDASDTRLGEKDLPFRGQLIAEGASQASEMPSADENLPEGYQGSVEWRPRISDPGFYRIRVTMEGAHGRMMERVVSLAVVQQLPRSLHGEFGWSLASVEKPLSIDALTRLLPDVGIHWVKVPVWYREGDDAFGDRILRFAEHLAASGIELVGVLDHPPLGSELAQTLDATAGVADIMARNPAVWATALEPIMTRLSLRVRWWQLGADRDTSFVGYPNLFERIVDIRKQLYRFGQDVNLGIAWRWIEEAVLDDSAPWEFLQYSADPPLTGDELEAYLEETRDASAMRWALIEPLPRDQYPLDTRTRDLVVQMLAAKISQADAAFVTEPFHHEMGLMNPDGTPGELFLPWRTTASLLGGSTHLGSLQLPQGSRNHVFQHRDGTFVLVIWNDRPVRETIYLGDEIRRMDIWGRQRVPETDGERHILTVDSVPGFYIGLSAPVTRWRMAVELEHQSIPSVFGKVHRNFLLLSNPFPQGSGGHAEIATEDDWDINPAQIRFRLASGESLRLPFDVTLPFNASSGRRQVRIDFELSADRVHRFSVYRNIDVGLGDIEVELSTHLDEDGTLIVEQRMVNRGDGFVDFRCFLTHPKRRRQRKHVFRLGRGQDVQQYRFPNGGELVGEELRLRAVELGGSRVLNYRFRVEE